MEGISAVRRADRRGIMAWLRFLQANLFAGKAAFMLNKLSQSESSYIRSLDLSPGHPLGLQGLREARRSRRCWMWPAEDPHPHPAPQVYQSKGDDVALIPILEALAAAPGPKQQIFRKDLAEALARQSRGAESAQLFSALLLEPAVEEGGSIAASAAEALWGCRESLDGPGKQVLVQCLDRQLAQQPDRQELVERRLQSALSGADLAAACLARAGSPYPSVHLCLLRELELRLFEGDDPLEATSAAALAQAWHRPDATLGLSPQAALERLARTNTAYGAALALVRGEGMAASAAAGLLLTGPLWSGLRQLEAGRPAAAAAKGTTPPLAPAPVLDRTPPQLVFELALLAATACGPEEALAAFKSLSASASDSGRLRCLEGVAWCLLEQRDAAAAEKVVAKAKEVIGRGSFGPQQAAYHSAWAAGAAGRAAALAGDTTSAEQRLTDALDSASGAGPLVPPSRVAQWYLWRAEARSSQGEGQRPGALADFRAAAESAGPQQAAAFAGLGRLLVAAGDIARAAKCLQRALALRPEDEDSGRLLASALQRSGPEEEARGLQALVETGQGSYPWAYRRLAAVRASGGDHRAAVQCLWAFLKQQSSDAEAWEALGASYYALRQLQPALKAFTRAAELSPELGQGTAVYRYLMCGDTQLSMGDAAGAEPFFRRALDQAPNDPAVLHGTARVLSRLAQLHVKAGVVGAAATVLKEAVSLCERALSLDPCLPSVHKLLGDLLQASLLSEDPATSPFAPGADPVAAALQLQQDRIRALQRARRHYAKAVHLFPSAAGSLHVLADTAQCLVRESHIRRQHSSLAGPGPSSTAGAAAGPLASLRGRAERLLRGLLRVEPSSPELWHALGAATEDRAAKEYSLARALQLDPRRAPSWIALGRLYDDEGEAQAAARCYEEARCHDPRSGETWEAMGQQRTKAGAVVDQRTRKERLDLADIAVSLGSGFLGSLWRAKDALALGPGEGGDTGPALAAAQRAAGLEPLSPLAWNTLGMALEAHGLAGKDSGRTVLSAAASYLPATLQAEPYLATAPPLRFWPIVSAPKRRSPRCGNGR